MWSRWSGEFRIGVAETYGVIVQPGIAPIRFAQAPSQQLCRAALIVAARLAQLPAWMRRRCVHGRYGYGGMAGWT